MWRYSFIPLVLIAALYYSVNNEGNAQDKAGVKSNVTVKTERVLKQRTDICRMEEFFTNWKRTTSRNISEIQNDERKEEKSSSLTTVFVVIMLAVSLIKSIIDAVNAKNEKPVEEAVFLRRDSLSDFERERRLRRVSSRPGMVDGSVMEKLRRHVLLRSHSSGQHETVKGACGNWSSGETTPTVASARRSGTRRPPSIERRSSVPVMMSNSSPSGSPRRQSTNDSNNDLTQDDKHKRVRILRRF